MPSQFWEGIQIIVFKTYAVKRRRKINLVEDLCLHEVLARDEVIKLYGLIRIYLF